MSIVDEIWKDVVGYEGFYQVSNLGRVRSCDRYVEQLSRRGNPANRVIKGRILSPRIARGYSMVTLHSAGLGDQRLIHVLVAQAFIGDRPKDFDINHIDGNKANNRLSNLEYCTRSQNIRHSYKLGLQIPLKGELRVEAKLTDAKVLEIRGLIAQGLQGKTIAKMYGVNPSLISKIRTRKLWSHI